jgi:iron-sulfur cluster repair protein YtfE (RIC family)
MSLINQYFAADHDRLDCLYLAFKSHLVQGVTQEQAHTQCLKFFNAFTQGLIKHIEWEETILFPFFEQSSGITQGPTRVMCSEHEIIKQLLVAIAEKVEQKNNEIDELEQLETILTDHNNKEEQVLYPMIDRFCDVQKTADLFIQMV